MGVIPIAQAVYRVDRSYSWNYGHAPKLPRVRRLPSAPGGKLFDYGLNSQLGIASGPLLNSKWIEAYARVGYDVLTYATVRTSEVPAFGLPNIRTVENREQAAVATTPRRSALEGDLTLAVSLGTPSTETVRQIWRSPVFLSVKLQLLPEAVAGPASETPRLCGPAPSSERTPTV